MINKVFRNDLHNKIVGIWDVSKLQLKIGFQLIFVEQLLIQKFNSNKEGISIIIIDLDHAIKKSYPLIFAAITQVNDCFISENINDVIPDFLRNELTVWNPFQSSVDTPINTMLIQRFFKKEKNIPFIQVKNKLFEKALSFYRKHSNKKLPVIVHLKQTKSGDVKSNAKLIEWKKFFVNCQRYRDVVFVLIGNEKIGQFFQNQNNVICAFDKGSNLHQDLAMIQNAYFFMGMASGPSNMAIFSDVPYTIFKDSDHHSKDMQKELGSMNHFPFACQNQKVVRGDHSADNLMYEFNNLLNLTSRNEWRKRLAKNSTIQ